MNSIIKRVWNQNRLVNIEDLTGMVFQAEADGHTFEISGVDDEGNAVALSGTVAGVFRRPDNADIALTGSASDGVVSVTLDENCYAVPGRFALTIFVTSDGQTVAVYACVGTVAATSGGSVAGDTPESVVDLIADIEAAVATIPPTYTALMASIAPTYSSSALYGVGSYAWYNGSLYRCITAITTAEAWTAAHWTAAVLGDDVGDLKSALYSDISLNWTDGKFISDVGTEYDSDLFSLSNPIPVSPQTTAKIITDIQGSAVICVKDENGNTVQHVNGTSGVKPYEITFVNGAANMFISCYKANKAKASVSPLYVSDSLTNFINKNGSSIARPVKSDEVIDGHLLTKDGYIAETQQWETSDYIPVYPSDSLTLVCYLYGNGAVVFYDSDKNVLFGIDGNNASEYGTTASYIAYRIVNLNDVSNVAFVRFSAWKNYKRVTGCVVSYSAPWKKHAEQLLGRSGETYADKKVLVIGDSISSDAYGNYKKWVTNLIDEGKLKLSNTTNSSQHATGFVARYSSQTPDDFITRLEAITNKSKYDLVIVFGGINDYIQNVPLGGEDGETDKTVYFKPAVDYFFNYLVENFTQARICVLLPLRTYNIYPNTAGNKQEVYAQYIYDVAKSYCLPVLNLTEESGFCPFNDTFKQMWTLIPSGYTNPDGTHPNAEYEKKYLAPMIWKFISGLID